MVACGTSSGVVYVYDKNTGKVSVTIPVILQSGNTRL